MPLSLSTAIGPVHEKPPLCKGWHKGLHDRKLAPNVGPMVGGRTSRSTMTASSMLAGQWQLTTMPYMKSDSFSQNNISECTTFTQQLTGWLQQCATPSQGAQKMGPCARGLCPFDNEGTLVVTSRPRTGSLQSQSILREREHLHPCPRSQATWRMRVQPAKLTEEMR